MPNPTPSGKGATSQLQASLVDFEHATGLAKSRPTHPPKRAGSGRVDFEHATGLCVFRVQGGRWLLTSSRCVWSDTLPSPNAAFVTCEPRHPCCTAMLSLLIACSLLIFCRAIRESVRREGWTRLLIHPPLRGRLRLGPALGALAVRAPFPTPGAGVTCPRAGMGSPRTKAATHSCPRAGL